MVYIRYCEVCGIRVSEEDLETGNGIVVGDNAWCGKHKAQGIAHLKSLKAGHKGSTPKTGGRGKAGGASRKRKSTSNRTQPQGAKQRRTGRGRENFSRPHPAERKTARRSRRSLSGRGEGDYEKRTFNKTLLLAAGAGMVFVVILITILFMMFSGPKKVPVTEKARAPAPEKPVKQEIVEPEPQSSPAQDATGNTVGLEESKPIVFSDDDRDGDGMRDEWEYIFRLNHRDISDAGEDTDGDGAINLHEFLENKNPLDKDNFPSTGARPAPPGYIGERTLVTGRLDIRYNFEIDEEFPHDERRDSSYMGIEAHSSLPAINHAFIVLKDFDLKGFVELKSAMLRLMPTKTTAIQGTPFDFIIGALDDDISKIEPKTWRSMKDIKENEKYVVKIHITGSPSYDKYQEFDVAKIVKAWVNKEIPNYGFIIHFDKEREGRHRKIFWYNRNHQGGKYTPQLAIVYSAKMEHLPNNPPVLSKPEPGAKLTIDRNQAVTLSAEASDADGDKIQYVWDFFAADGLAFDDAEGQTATFKTDKPGLRLVVVRAKDPYGGKDYATIVVDVK